jgi:hypothetical protein
MRENMILVFPCLAITLNMMLPFIHFLADDMISFFYMAAWYSNGYV